MKIYLIGLLLCCSFAVEARSMEKKASDTASITLHIRKQYNVRFTYYDDFLVPRELLFKNPTEKDTTITKKIFSKFLTELRYSVMDGLTNTAHFYLIYVKGGDQITLETDHFKFKNLTDNKYLFLSDYLTVDDSIFAVQVEGGPQAMIAANKRTYAANMRRVDSLFQAKQLSDSVAELWKEVANNAYRLKDNRMRYSKGAYLDTMITELKQLVSKEQRINSTFLNGAIYSLGNYQKVKNGLNHNLKFFIEEIIKINTQNRLKAGVVFRELAIFPEKGSKLYADSYALFVKAFNDPLLKSQSYYSAVDPTLAKLDKTTVKLISYQNKALSLEDIFKKNRGKLMVFDFWASWCVPCIAEFPALEQIKLSLRNRDIVFITLSLDKDDKVKDWKESLLKHKVNQGNQFRLVGKSNQAISALYKISSIPRYLVFDRKGMLINDNFVKPSAQDFEKKLLAYIN